MSLVLAPGPRNNTKGVAVTGAIFQQTCVEHISVYPVEMDGVPALEELPVCREEAQGLRPATHEVT